MSVYYHWEVLEPLQSNFLASIKIIALYKGTTGDCALVVTQNGEIYGVGKSAVGCLGLGEVVELTEPRILNEIAGVLGVSMCGDYGDVLAVTTEGKLYTWGSNSNANCSPTIKSELSDVNIVDAKCIAGNYLVLTKEGEVYQWRGNIFEGSKQTTTTPTMVEINEVVVSIACGSLSSLVTTKSGNVYAWGIECRSNSIDDCHTRDIPVKIVVQEDKPNNPEGDIKNDEHIVKVACSMYYHLVLTDSGKMFSWGRNDHGMGNGKISSATAVLIPETCIAKFVDISLSNNRCAAVTEERVIYIWGEGGNSFITYAPNYNEMHQAFAESSSTRFLWTCNSSDAIDWEGFNCPMAEKLKTCFNCEDLSDLTIIVDEKPIYVHKLILQLRSSFFRTMLQEHWTEKNTREIKLYSFSYAVYLAYFWYLYSGEVKTPIEHILELWNLGNAYNEANLKQACVKLMKRNLSYEDLAEQHSIALMMKCHKPSTDQQDTDESSSSLQAEHMKPIIEEDNDNLLDKMQKDFSIKLEKLAMDHNCQPDELTSLQNKYTTQKTKLTSLQHKYTTQKNELTSLQYKYTTKKNELVLLQHKYTTQNNELTSLQDEYTRHKHSHTCGQRIIMNRPHIPVSRRTKEVLYELRKI